VVLSVTNSTNAPFPGATVYLRFTPCQGGGSATVGSTKLTTSSTAFTADSEGKVYISYNVPAGALPSSGTDSLAVKDAVLNSTVSAADTYQF
jgi:hypothetical protein